MAEFPEQEAVSQGPDREAPQEEFRAVAAYWGRGAGVQDPLPLPYCRSRVSRWYGEEGFASSAGSA